MKKKGSNHWKQKRNRINAIKEMVAKLKKCPDEITRKDFRNHGLEWLARIKKGMGNALIEAGFNVKIYRPRGHWKLKRNRTKAIQDMILRSGKSLDKITTQDFHMNRLSSILLETGGIKNAMAETGYILPDKKKPNGFWDNKEKRVKAIKKMVLKTGNPVNEITFKDFKENRLTTVLRYYNNSYYKALKDAGFNIQPWELKNLPLNYWKQKSHRKKAIIWLTKKLKKKVRELNENDFKKHGMKQIIVQYGGIYRSISQAGFEIKFRIKPNGYWKKRIRRVKKIIKLVNRLGKPPEEVFVTDFLEADLSGLLFYYNQSAIDALRDAGYQISKETEKQRRYLPGRKKKYFSNHGHKFVSSIEKEIDNYLWNNGIREHEHNKKYPNSNMNCDIVIGNYWIEVAGLMKIDWYRKKMKEKEKIAKQNGFNFILITQEEQKKEVLEKKFHYLFLEHKLHKNMQLDKFIG